MFAPQLRKDFISSQPHRVVYCFLRGLHYLLLYISANRNSFSGRVQARAAGRKQLRCRWEPCVLDSLSHGSSDS